jgi:4-amino-4-deoxy-L-arabinose transferase-like glycosyltransferase
MTAASVRMVTFGRRPPPARLAFAVVLAAVICAAAALRLEAAGDRPGHSSADERAYVQLASDLRAGGNYGNPTMAHPLHWAPGAPALFALTDAIGGQATSGGLDRRAARRAQAIVGALTVAAAFGLAALITNAWAGIVAALAVAFYPPMIAATSHLTSEPLGALAITAALVALAWAWRRGRPAPFAAAGVAVGLACLVRADVLLSALLLGPVVGVLQAHRAGWRAGAVTGALVLAGVLAIVGPWSAWASRRERAFVPVTDGAASTLFVGTYLPGHGTIFGLKHALAKEAARVHPSIRHEPLFRVRESVFLDAVAARHPHMSRDAAIAAEARRNLRVYLLGHPIGFARMVARKGWRMWGFPLRGSFGRRDRATLWLHRLLVALAIAGLLAGLVLRRSATLALVLAIVGVTAVVDIAFVAEARHAFRLMPALLAAGAAGWAMFAPGPSPALRSRSAPYESSRRSPGAP